MIDERFVLFGVLLSLIGTSSYFIDTIRGKVKPNKVSFFIWGLAPMLAFAAEIRQGVGLPALMTFIVGFGPLMVFIASFTNPKANWKVTKLDIVCGALSLVGLILWLITQVGNLAILFGILADGLAAVPTVIKSYRAPETENYKMYLFSGINAAITLLAIKSWDFEHSAFPIYILLICALLFALIKFRVGPKFSKTEQTVLKS